jgi:hypothetical protein
MNKHKYNCIVKALKSAYETDPHDQAARHLYDLGISTEDLQDFERTFAGQSTPSNQIVNTFSALRRLENRLR